MAESTVTTKGFSHGSEPNEVVLRLTEGDSAVEFKAYCGNALATRLVAERARLALMGTPA